MMKLRVRGLTDLAPVLPAPMSGYSDRAQREIARRFGCDLTIVPLISAEGFVRDDRKTIDLIDIDGEPRPVCVQLFGRRPEAMAEAARRVEAMEADAVDLNLGCPAHKVVRHDNGAGLLRYPEIIREVVAAMRAATSLPFTVKIRAGWDERSTPAVEIARLIEREGADAIIIHGRTGKQGFRGTADWRAIAEVKAAVGIPVIGNGDVVAAEDAWRMIRETGCDAVMIGRGAVGNPWLFRDARALIESGGDPAAIPPPPSFAERLELLVEHARLMVHYGGEPKSVIEFRKHAVHYLRGIRDVKPLKQALLSARTLADIEKAADEFQANELARADSSA